MSFSVCEIEKNGYQQSQMVLLENKIRDNPILTLSKWPEPPKRCNSITKRYNIHLRSFMIAAKGVTPIPVAIQTLTL